MIAYIHSNPWNLRLDTLQNDVKPFFLLSSENKPMSKFPDVEYLGGTGLLGFDAAAVSAQDIHGQLSVFYA